MKSLRRSFNQRDSNATNGHLPISAPLATLPPISRPNVKTQPPKKVIRATDSYRPRAPQELGFSKGDFFHVVMDADPNNDWYEAHNPMTGARGLVPKRLFEEFTKGHASLSSTSSMRTNSFSGSSLSKPSTPGSQAPTSQRLKTFFAVVMHDFTAERPDELDAAAGDNITVVAQSNFEWFVAKPIGKLGRPGLIPVSFVEVKDPASGSSIPETKVVGLMKSGEIPRVEDWKRAMIAYKAASIPLGVLDDTATPVPNSPFMANHNNTRASQQSDSYGNSHSAQHFPDQQPYHTATTHVEDEQYDPLPFGILVRARIESFHYENDDFWFRITATWQPLENDTLTPSGPHGRITIFRVYEDFYNFQIRLLDAFPHEAGRADDPSTESGISTRILPYMPGPVEQVDNVVSSLRQDELDQYLQQLTMLDQIDASYILSHELIRDFFTPRAGDVPLQIIMDEPYSELERSGSDELAGMKKLSLDNGRQRSSYGQRSIDENRHSQGRESRHSQGRSLSRANSRSGSNGIRRTGSSASRPSTSDMSPPTPAGRLRSGSTANAPSISATNSQTAFIKIKIFDRTSDDLIAIRVSPRVLHRQLLEKVRERLGGEIRILNYRDPSNTRFVPLDGDEQLRDWLEHTDKHVLYAE